MNKKDILNIIPEHKKQHSQNVVETALKIAACHDVDEEKTFYAGLMHDIAKDQTPEKMIKENIPVSNILKEIYRHYKPIYHAYAAPIFVKTKLGIFDETILNAIKWHTTGRPAMTKLEQIIYVSDYIEPGREHVGIDFIKNLAYASLDKACYLVSVCSVQYLLKTAKRIHPATIRCRNYYLERIEEADLEKLHRVAFFK
jgi:predicted HD superfamily hydrolase involved in NAD metabolism